MRPAPKREPNIAPTTRTIASVKGMLTLSMYERNPVETIRKILASDVPTAWRGGMLSTLINKGTITKPPPTPRTDETKPPVSPIKIVRTGEMEFNRVFSELEAFLVSKDRAK